MATSIISRKEAKLLGLKYYYTGPCKHGHDCPKFVSNYGCVDCLHSQSQTPEYKKNQAKFRSTDEGRFVRHKSHAKCRGIEFLLTFDEWMKIWEDSGRYHERGNVPGKFVMGRFKDEGPYAIGNVSIIPFYDNLQAPNQLSVRDCDDQGYPQV